MLKRVILVGTTLACVLLGLFLYQQSSDTFNVETLPAPSSASKPIADNAAQTSSESDVDFVTLGQGVSVRTITGLKFTARDEQGRISNEFGFEQRRVNQAGEHEFDKPWIKFYKKKQIIKMTADVLTTPVETQRQLPESGWLEGKVRIELFRTESPLTDSVQEEPGQRDMLVELERVNFHREFSRIYSPGTVKISSASFNASGSQLTIRYDQLHSRLAELELRHLDTMEYLSGQPETSSHRTNSPAAQTSSPQAALPSSKQANVYRLSLVNQVVIHQGSNRIEADRIEILAKDLPFRSDHEEEKEKLSSNAANKATPASEKEQPTTTTLTCSGPLRVVPVESHELPEPAQNLQVQLFGKPIRLWQDDRLSLVASAMSYDPGSDIVNLKGDSDQPIRFMFGTDQWASAARDAQWDRPNGLAILNGPGQVANQAAESNQPFKINYRDTLKIKLDTHEQIEWIELNGDVRGWSENLTFASEHLTAQLTYDENKNISPQLIRAKGSARAETAEYIVEAGEMLEITFKPHGKRGKESPDVQAESDSELNSLFGPPSNLHSVLATGPDGSVRITDKMQKIRIAGNRLEGDSLQQYWTIHGQPARIENLAKDRDFQTIESSVIIADLQRGQYKIPGEGSLTTLVQNNGLGKEIPATIHWKKGVIYNLENKRIDLKEVFVTMHEQGLYSESQTEITTAALSIILAEESGPDSSATHQNIGRLSTLIAHGPEVRLIRKETNRLTHEPVSLMEIRAMRLEFDHAVSTLLIHGAGWLEMTDFLDGSIEPKDKENRPWQSETPMYTLIRFTKFMRYQLDKDQITLAGHVMVDQIPLVTEMDMDFTASPKVEGMKQLTCDRLSFAISHTINDETPSTSSPGLTQSLNRLDHLSAEGNIFFETFFNRRHHTFTAQGLTFEKKTYLAIFQGTQQSPVQFDQIRFSQVLINIQTGDIDTKPVGHSEMATRF